MSFGTSLGRRHLLTLIPTGSQALDYSSDPTFDGIAAQPRLVVSSRLDGAIKLLHMSVHQTVHIGALFMNFECSG